MKQLILLAGFLLAVSPAFATQNISTIQNGDINLISSDTINLNSGGVLNGNINLGSSASSALNINLGSAINGNLTMGNSAQITTFNGGNLNGTISGAGRIVVADNLVTNGNISGITSLAINPAKTLNLATNNNSFTASSSLTVGSGSNLIIGSGVVSSTIQGATDGVGTVKFNANNSLGGNVGTTTTTLSLVEIATGVTLTTNTRNIDATLISLNHDAILNYGSGTITGAVEGKTNHQGIFQFNNTKTTAFTIGQNNSLSAINVANGATITLGGNIVSDTVNIGSGTSGKIRTNGKNITATDIKLAKGASLEIDGASNISGAINGVFSGNGIVQFSGSGAINLTSSLGATNKLEQVLISNESTLNLNNVNLNADDITIGEGSSGGVGTPTLNQNSGIIGADANSLIRLNSDAIFNYNGGTINGTVRGTSSNRGTFNINYDYTNNSEIGQSYDLANLNIASGKTLTAGANISANNILVRGTLNLGNSSKTITGNITTSGGSAIIDLGSSRHSLNGNFFTTSGDILKLTALNNLNVGRLSSSGNINVASGTNLQISFNSDDGYLSDKSRIAIVSGSSGSASGISGNNINVNNSESNKVGLFTFNTESSGSNLYLIVNRDDASSFTSDKFAQNIYQAIDQAGSSATGNLRNLQKFIDNPQTTNSSRESALKSIIPQANQEINNSAINAAKSAVGVVNSRLDSILLNQKTANFISSNFSNENIRSLNHLHFEDEVFDNQAVWIQGYSTSAKQDQINDMVGYDYEDHGLAIGVDQEIARDLRVGISASFSQGEVKSQSITDKQTNINSYQFNLYGGYVFESYFISAVAGIAVNQFNSVRKMPDLAANAKADYNGQTYIAKIESGINEKFSSGLFLIPKVSLVYAKNQIATYSESGAGTLNLRISNQHNDFLEARIGSDFGYDDLKINEFNIRPKIKVSYGYDLLASEQSSKNNFEGQNNYFQIKNSADNRASLKYGFGFDLYDEDLILVNLEYNIESRSGYQSSTSSIYLRYKF